MVVDKKQLKRTRSQFDSKLLYFEAIKRLLYDNNPVLSHAVLVIDESTAKIHQVKFNAKIKKSVSNSLIKKIRQKRSGGEAMIQIADFIAGSIFRKYEKGDDQYYKLINKRQRISIEF